MKGGTVCWMLIMTIFYSTICFFQKIQKSIFINIKQTYSGKYAWNFSSQTYAMWNGVHCYSGLTAAAQAHCSTLSALSLHEKVWISMFVWIISHSLWLKCYLIFIKVYHCVTGVCIFMKPKPVFRPQSAVCRSVGGCRKLDTVSLNKLWQSIIEPKAPHQLLNIRRLQDG